jgi:hypothetical protein
MEFKLNLPSKDKNKIFIKMINPIIGNLTSKEIDILIVIADKQISKLDKDTRTDVRMYLNMDKFNFNNYIKKLKEKKILIPVDRITLNVNPKLLHILKHDSLNLTFV